MIGKLSGIIDNFGPDYILLDVAGVGYLVHCSPRPFEPEGIKESQCSFLIDTIVREDAINFYGFKDAMEQQWFRLLTSVQGVGARVGMAILGTVPPERLGFVIVSGDKAAIQATDGVGPKLAVRIVTELKDKAGKIDLQISVPKSGSKTETPAGIDNDAVSALVNLGYTKSDAYQAVLSAKQKADNDNLSDIIRLALKELSA